MCRGPPKDSNLFSGWSGSPQKKTGFKLLSRLAMVKTWLIWVMVLPYWESMAVDGWMIIIPWVHGCSRTLRSLPGCASQQTTGAQRMPNRSRYCFPGDYDHDDQRLGRRKNTHYGEWMTLRSQVWGSKTVLFDHLPMHFHAITTHVISREHVVWSQDKRTRRMLISPWLTFCSEKSQEWSLEGHDCLATWSGHRTGNIWRHREWQWAQVTNFAWWLGATEARCPMPPSCRPTSWHLPLAPLEEASRAVNWVRLRTSQTQKVIPHRFGDGALMVLW